MGDKNKELVKKLVEKNLDNKVTIDHSCLFSKLLL